MKVSFQTATYNSGKCIGLIIPKVNLKELKMELGEKYVVDVKIEKIKKLNLPKRTKWKED